MEKGHEVRLIPATKKRQYKKKVVLYARVSTTRAEQLRSLSVQVSSITRHVSNRDDWVLNDSDRGFRRLWEPV